MHRFFHEHGFYWINTPIITTSDAEGAGQMFRVSTLDMTNLPRDGKGEVDFSQDFFGKETFLTVSGQLNVEAYCLALTKVYTFGPTFRAENSNTTRHLAEFWMIEPEIAFADLNDDANLAEDFLKYLFQAVLDERARRPGLPRRARRQDRDQQAGGLHQRAVRAHRLHRCGHACCRSPGKKFEFPVEWGLDLQTEHERWLTEEHVGRPVVVMNYPEQIKAFYMRLNDDGKTVAAMDVLAPGIGEIIGGSQREERLDVLDARMAPVRPGSGALRAGTATSAATAPCRTPASASASSAWWSMSAACRTSATRSPTRARRAWRSSDRVDGLLFACSWAWPARPCRRISACACWPIASMLDRGTGHSRPAPKTAAAPTAGG